MPTHRPLTEQARTRVAAAAAAGKLIVAIKLYREATGVDLRDAKDAVEAMVAGRPVAPMEVAPAESVVAAVRGGRRIAAIKLYREAHGVDLRDAKEAVEAIAADLLRADPTSVPPRPAGCGRAALVLVLAAAGCVITGYVLLHL